MDFRKVIIEDGYVLDAVRIRVHRMSGLVRGLIY